jgi:hypothetical protein
MVAVLPVDPPAPGDEPVAPVTPEPTAVVVPTEPAVPPGDAGGLVGVGVPVGVVGVVGVVVGVVGSVVVVVGAAAVKSLVKLVEQVTVLPPPLAEPLHWLMVTGSADAPPVTLHCTRVLAPPPFPEPLHWVTVAFVVLATGAQTTVGCVPPPVPEPTH